MNFIDLFVSGAQFFPPLSIKSSSTTAIRYVFPPIDENRYITFSLFIAFVISLSIFFFVTIDLVSIAFFLILFALIFLFLLRLPLFIFKISVSKMETELPFVLRTLGLLLEMNVPFSKALHIVSEEKGEFNFHLKKLVTELDKGASFHKTFTSFATFTQSFLIQRAVAQIQSAYASGEGAHELKSLAYELLSIQRLTLREYASKSALIGLLFIAVSTIFPTFFIVVTALGDTVLDTSIETSQVPFIFLIVFPLVSVLIILIARALSPRLVFKREEPFNYAPVVALFAISFSLLFLTPPLNFSLAFLSFGALIFLFFREYNYQKRIEEMETYIPDALMLAATMPYGTKLEKIFYEWKRNNYGTLSKESTICLQQLGAHVGEETVLYDLQSRYPSQLLRRVTRFIQIALTTNTLKRLSSVAEDVLMFREIDRERRALLSVQRYTILFASVLTPLIIKSALSLVTSVRSFAPVHESATTTLFSTLIPVYIVIFAALSAYFIAEVEGQRHNTSIYFLGSAVLGGVTFYFISL